MGCKFTYVINLHKFAHHSSSYCYIYIAYVRIHIRQAKNRLVRLITGGHSRRRRGRDKLNFRWRRPKREDVIISVWIIRPIVMLIGQESRGDKISGGEICQVLHSRTAESGDQQTGNRKVCSLMSDENYKIDQLCRIRFWTMISVYAEKTFGHYHWVQVRHQQPNLR